MPASTKWLGSGTLLTLARLLVTLAALVPGGRMVKWLEEITVTPAESDNFYHFHDNRVLPPGIDQERAKAEGAPARARARAPQQLVKSGKVAQHAVRLLAGLFGCLSPL